MGSTKLIVSIAAILLAFVYTLGAVEEHIDCRKMMMVIAKKQLKVFGECSREMRAQIPDADEYQTKIQCVVKCSMKKEDMLNENYQVTNASITSFLDKNVPKVFHEIGHMFMENCLAKYDGKFDVEDPLCTTYGEFLRCMQNNVADIC